MCVSGLILGASPLRAGSRSVMRWAVARSPTPVSGCSIRARRRMISTLSAASGRRPGPPRGGTARSGVPVPGDTVGRRYLPRYGRAGGRLRHRIPLRYRYRLRPAVERRRSQPGAGDRQWPARGDRGAARRCHGQACAQVRTTFSGVHVEYQLRRIGTVPGGRGGPGSAHSGWPGSRSGSGRRSISGRPSGVRTRRLAPV